MINIKKEILIGFLVGILTTACGFYLYLEFFSTFSFNRSLALIHQQNLYAKVLGYAVIPNLAVFFLFIKKKQDYRARGVLMATILVALIILISKLV